jgi:hypothetical protein
LGVVCGGYVGSASCEELGDVLGASLELWTTGDCGVDDSSGFEKVDSGFVGLDCALDTTGDEL